MVEPMDANPSRRTHAAQQHRAPGDKPQLPAILRCYPRAWRERYGDELAELIARESRSPRLAFDLARGAIDAHLHPQVGAARPSRVRRVIGVALLAGVLVAAGYVGQHPAAARTISALVAARPAAPVAVTATPEEHGYGPRGLRHE
jgi:hypothetical protein